MGYGPRLMVAAACAALATAGCSEYEIAEGGTPPTDDDPPGADDDDAGDDDSTGADDDAPPPEPCDDSALPDLTIDAGDACADEPLDTQFELLLTHSALDVTACDAIHAGTFLDTNGDGVVDASDERQIWMWALQSFDGFQHDGHRFGRVLEDIWQAHATLGDVDPGAAGMELVVAWSDHPYPFDSLSLIDETGVAWSVDLPCRALEPPWLTDLEGNGSLEVLVGAEVIDAIDGSPRFTLEGMPCEDSGVAHASDLDLDGSREIIGTEEYDSHRTALFAADGSLRQVCREGTPDAATWDYPAIAVGDLDGDPEGEFVTAGNGYLTQCDSDGSFIAEADVGTVQPALIGLAELDGDPRPEILIGDNWALIAVDDDLSLLWTYIDNAGGDWWWYPFTVADLDGDGYHEILLNHHGRLVVLDGEGQVRGSVDALQSECMCWICAPAVLDVDADGLAEIVVPGWTAFGVVENAAGGWLLDGADAPWPGSDKHPGDRAPDGSLPPPSDVHWSEPRTNVWQGLPAGGLPYRLLPDLVVESVDVCVDPDDGEEHVQVYVGNRGYHDAEAAIGVTLRSPVDDAPLAETELPPPLPAETARAVVFVLPPGGATAHGLTVLVDEAGAVPECCDDDNGFAWSP